MGNLSTGLSRDTIANCYHNASDLLYNILTSITSHAMRERSLFAPYFYAENISLIAVNIKGTLQFR